MKNTSSVKKTHNMTVIEGYKKMAAARSFFDEYRNLSRLVDDLDVRFWKRYVMRDSRRQRSIDNDIAEERLRMEYTKCVSDLVEMRTEVNNALTTVSSTLAFEVLTEYFIRDLSIDEIADKWNMRDCHISQAIQEGLLEADIPKRYFNG